MNKKKIVVSPSPISALVCLIPFKYNEVEPRAE